MQPSSTPLTAPPSRPDADSLACVRTMVVYAGRVQGVGFRATARHLARDFAVTGWVRNEHDGTVRLEAQGEPDEVERFLAAIKTQQAHLIRSTTTMQVRELVGESAFEIRR